MRPTDFLRFISSTLLLSALGSLHPVSAAAGGANPSSPATVKPRHLTGAVLSVDPAAKQVTVERDVGTATQVITFTAEGGASLLLGSLKRGDQVDIGYSRERGHLAAAEISRVQPGPEKETAPGHR